MKTWMKPKLAQIDIGMEVTRYLPSELDIVTKNACGAGSAPSAPKR